MIIIKLSSGLGNQMFQYAFSLPYRLSGAIVKYDVSYYNQYKCHNGFELTKIFDNIIIPEAHPKDIFYFVESMFENGQKHYRLKRERQIINEKKEDEFLYNCSLAALNDAYFAGYWQNKNYFKNYEKEVRQAFTFPEILADDMENFKLLQQIASANSVSMHIRRGDYLQSPIHLNLQIAYYQSAIEIIHNKIPDPVFFIFSDDINWVKENLNIRDAVFINHNKGQNSYRDMQLMSNFKHNIIANITFSWWAAWLNNNKEKTVIAPEKWFNYEVDLSGLLVEKWITIA